jgi:putative hydrolase of the HAD superfamily
MLAISLDFWMTCGLPNPDYPALRTKYLSERYNVDPEHVEETRKKYKKRLDKIAEQGYGFTCFQNLSGYLWELTGQSVNATKPYIYLNELFLKHPPIVLPEVKEAIKKMARSCIIGITSNTNFIPGATIAKACLMDLPIRFMLFSDELGVTKPNPVIFKKFHEQASIHINHPIIKSNVLHVGDSLTYDGPAKDFGFDVRIINHPTELLQIANEIA